MTAIVLLSTAGALLVLQGVTFVVALRVGKHSVVDTAWGIGIALAALTAFLASVSHGDPVRRALLLAASALWGLRLAAYVGWRNHGKPEDPRYADLPDDRHPDPRHRRPDDRPADDRLPAAVRRLRGPDQRLLPAAA